MTTQTPSRSAASWSFVANKVKIEAPLPYEIVPGVVIRHATRDERTRALEKLDQLVGNTNHLGTTIRHWYEFDNRPLPNNPGQTGLVRLAEPEWRYYVVEGDPNGNVFCDLHRALLLADSGLLLCLDFMDGAEYGGTRFNAWVLQTLFDMESLFKAPDVITQTALVEYSSLYARVQPFLYEPKRSEAPEIEQAIMMFDALNRLPENSTFHAIGLFAIIEMLISHNPKLEDRGDSITHQIKTKMPLLLRLFEKPIDTSQYFGPAGSDKVWSTLYSWRSCIAHGGIADFNVQLKLLRSAEVAQSFLEAIVKGLILQTTKDPQFIRDLKAV